MINELIAALITVGGMGFMNFLVTDQLGVVDVRHDQKTEIVAYSLLWSIFDYAIYLGLLSIFSKIGLSTNWTIVLTLLGTLTLSFLITLGIARPLSWIIISIYNHAPGQEKYASFRPGNVFVDKLNNNNRSIAYIYDFDHKPIEFGVVDEFSVNDNGEQQLSLIPSNESQQPEYDDLKNYLSQENIHNETNPYTFIDTSHKLIMIFLNQ